MQILARKLQGNGPSPTWKNCIEMGLRETGSDSLNCIRLTQVIVRWQISVNSLTVTQCA